MRGLGRLIALPWLLVALAVQGLAPAQAQAMPRDAFGLPICSVQGHGDRHQDPSHGQAHDCCAAACALAGLTGAPPALTSDSPAFVSQPVDFRPERRSAAADARPDRPPNARAPPASSTT
jgi:hypothetical protein